MSSWYGVKTLYRWEAVGEARNIDAGFDSESTVLEERVVLIRADSFDEAIEKAEGEAKEYSDQTYINFYGQTVQVRYLQCCDAFDIGGESIEDFVELFSSRETVPASIKDSELIDNRMGKEVTIKDGGSQRDKFWNAELLTDIQAQRKK